MRRVTTFRQVRPVARGLVRDLRVRWALEEAGQPYAVHHIELGAGQADPEYRRLQPFGQVPAYEEGGLELFESGAIVHHIAEGCETLLPHDPALRARTITWMYAALCTIEPKVQNLTLLEVFHADEEWAKLRHIASTIAVRRRLADLAAYLGESDYLVGGRFTAADLLMTTVLRILRHGTLVAEVPALTAYQQRCEERPAFQRALAAQLAAYGE
jgi:glutathione S-transferase